MKRYFTLIILAFFIMTLLPVALLKDNIKFPDKQETTQSPPTNPTEGTKENVISVFRSAEDKTIELDFFEYVCGSVAAEMPLTYHEEALKAQAVACYTNALRLKNADSYSENAHISDDSSVHQGYLTEAQRKEKWGKDFEKYEAKLQATVKEVEGKALYYNGELCVAAFFALCSGTTESAENIWGEKIDYLVSVKSIGDSLSPQFTTKITLNKKDFLNRLSSLEIKTDNVTDLSGIIKITKKTKAGTVLNLKINGTEFTGEEIRSVFSLKSRVFTVECKKESVTFTVTGYGHGVGMSQYGADFSARQGSTYEEILKHYYKGAQIK